MTQLNHCGRPLAGTPVCKVTYLERKKVGPLVVNVNLVAGQVYL